jgi:CheY-like chemotaxis protein
MKRILIADDTATNRELLSSMLGYLGYAVSEAADGDEVLASVASEPPDLIILDIQMPKRDGFATLVELRRTLGPRVPVVALTAYAMQGDREKGLAAGFDEYLTKPVGLARLREVLRRLLG